VHNLNYPKLSTFPRFILWNDRLKLAKLRAAVTKYSTNRGVERYRLAALRRPLHFVAKALNILINFLSVPLTIHYLGSERYGVWLTILLARGHGLVGLAMAMAISKLVTFCPIQLYEVRRILRASHLAAPII
jgi:hypothetical protein